MLSSEILELPILSISILLPLISALYIMFFISQSNSPNKQLYAMYVAILSSVLTLIATLYLLIQFDSSKTEYQFVERYSWIDSIGLDFYVGIDGISLLFVVITAALSLICIIASLFTIKTQIKEFLLCFLLLESFCIGAFTSLNILLFYLFFEITLIPMYIIIGIWGGENRIYAAVKFFLYTFLGSVCFLLSLFYIYSVANSFDIAELVFILPTLDIDVQKILFILIFVAFAVKIPMVPLHTWLPDAHVQAPTAGSIILAGILLKIGGYAVIKFLLPMFTEVCRDFAVYILALSAFAVVYASLIAMHQDDMKKMIAYSSVAHMGYVTAGIFSFTKAGFTGAVFQMVSHSFVSSALFLVVGMLYERGHTKEIRKYGAVARKMPILAVCFMIAVLGSIALPGTSGFIGEFFCIVGLFEVDIFLAIFTSLAVILGAVYMLKLYKDVMLGEIVHEHVRSFVDLRAYEILAILPLMIFIIYFGLLPENILSIIENAIDNNLSLSELMR